MLWRRDLVRCREALLGALIAVGLLVPNVHLADQPRLDLGGLRVVPARATASDSPPLVYAGQQLAFLGVGAVLVVLGLVWLWRRPSMRPLALTSAAPTILFGLEQGRSYYALPAMLPALVAGCLALAERRPRRAALVALGIVHVAAAGARAAARRPGAPRAPARLDGNLGSVVLEGRDRLARADGADGGGLALAHAGRARGRRDRRRQLRRGRSARALRPAAGLPDAALGASLVPVLAPARMPERDVLLVGFDRAAARERCTRTTVLARVDNRWHVDNEERGRPIIWCRLRAALGTDVGALVRHRARCDHCASASSVVPIAGQDDADVLMRPEPLAQEHDPDDGAERRELPRDDGRDADGAACGGVDVGDEGRRVERTQGQQTRARRVVRKRKAAPGTRPPSRTARSAGRSRRR